MIFVLVGAVVVASLASRECPIQGRGGINIPSLSRKLYRLQHKEHKKKHNFDTSTLRVIFVLSCFNTSISEDVNACNVSVCVSLEILRS